MAQVLIEWPNRSVETFQVPIGQRNQIVQDTGESPTGVK